MSTISLPYENQIRHFYLATAVASETNIAAFSSTASIGEIQIFGHDGLNATTSGDFYIAKKNSKGTLSVSDLITPKDISYTSGVKPVSKIGKKQTFNLSSAPSVGKQFILTAKVHYGNSEENFISFVVAEKAKSGDTQDSILGRLAKQMSDVLAKSINTQAKSPASVVVSGAAPTGSVTITGASGSVDGITVDGVQIMSGAEAFDTSLTVTAANVAANINAFNSEPDYTATSAAGVITIQSLNAGVEDNGLVVVSSTTTLGKTDANLAGGTDGLSSTSNKYFSIEASDNNLYVAEKDWILEDFRVGLRTHDQLMWNFELSSPDDTENDKITKTQDAPRFAKGQGYQVIELERFLVGHRAETTDLLDSTLGFGRPYDTNINSSYYMLDLKYSDTSRQDPKKSEKMLTIVSTSVAAINTIGNAIEARGGKVWTDLT